MDDLDIKLLVDLLRDRIHPDSSLGQHFLLDENVINRAIEIASNNHPIDSSSHVLEIGPGPGSLTLSLLRKNAKVTAIEIDPEAISHLNRVFKDQKDNLFLIEGDVLTTNWPNDITHIVSNIPYQISSPIIDQIQRYNNFNPLLGISILVQDEFAERMSMTSGYSSRGPLGHALWLDFDVELDMKVSPHSFSPSPRVNSRLVKLKPTIREEKNNLDHRLFTMVITHCFANRRRKLRTLLSNPPRRLSRISGWHRDRWNSAIKSISSEILELRPENLSSLQWSNLISHISIQEFESRT
tara:strand:- start:4749 stop:5639 length:891 start_codon:yes stop_codon:yes gene_type:complete